MWRLSLRRAVYGVLLTLGLLSCGGDVETEPRTLASGRQIDVFRIFTQGGKNGLLLDYFYVSGHFREKAAFDAEWAEVVLDAQQEADKRSAVEVMLIASRRGSSVLSRLLTEDDRAAYFAKQDGAWVEIRPK